MDTPNRQVVRRALDALKPYLATYVVQALAEVRTARVPERGDMSALLASMVQNWDTIFARKLTPTVRHYVFELRDIRNRWAHEESFDDDEAQRAAHTARMVAKAIDAPKSLLDTLASLGGPTPSNEVSRPVRRSEPADGPSAGKVRRDAHGVIVNAVELTSDKVALQRVLCPACEKKVFETWPGGWDAHAAHVCQGLAPGSEEERKSAFRSRFAHLFRDGGVAAKPARQRDVMRRLYAIHGPDEERVIREYAAAERRGEARRSSNTHDLTPEEYARALLLDGQKKGWLPRRS